MNLKNARIHDVLAVTLLAIGLFWGTARISVRAQQSSAAPPAAGTIHVENGKLELRTLSGSLSDTVNRWAAATTRAEWLGYSVAEIKGDRSVCCGNGNNEHSNRCGPCRLESRNYSESISSRDNENKAKVNLEAPREIAVLFRAEAGKLTRIRTLSIECTVDAGGLNLVWLRNVNSSDSVRLLETFVRGTDTDSPKGENLGQGALTAIALHDDSSADRALESFVATSEPESLRRETSFWLGEARGAEGFRTLQKMAQNDPSAEVREQVTFAFSVSKESGALAEMIRMAHDDKSSQVRGQALFWLGQKAGEKAAKAITGSIDSDPDTEVKKKAVFALSQMPSEEGVPKLIQVAQSNRNPQIRKEAMFWLGQSEDPQALAFFEKVLSQ